MTSVHGISPYGAAAASSRVRLHDWFRHLHVQAEIHSYAGLHNSRALTMIRHPARFTLAEVSVRRLNLANATLIISREASPFSRGGVESRLLRRAAHGVFDFDDALSRDPSTFRRFFGVGQKTKTIMSEADRVIAGSDELASLAGTPGCDVVMIPSCIEPSDYLPKTDWSLREVPTIVWLGSPSTEQYIAQIAPALLNVHKQTGARLKLVSGAQDNPALDCLRPMLRRVPWTLASFAHEINTADVGVAPLDKSPYSQGKCAYKLLQYAATALPVVGSPVGANAQALERLAGLAPSTQHDWADCLIDLLQIAPDERRARGVRALEKVVRHYSFAAWSDTWIKAVFPSGRLD